MDGGLQWLEKDVGAGAAAGAGRPWAADTSLQRGRDGGGAAGGGGSLSLQRLDKDLTVVRGHTTPAGVRLLEPWCMMCEPRVPAVCWSESSFSHPHVMSRLERLMGSNVVRITDRKYMLELQRRIREDHIRSVRERIRAREVDELEREKKLILSGRMSLDEAPKELVDHPVFQISQFIKNVLLGGKIPWYLRAARNHVHPAALHQMASSVSHSTSSRQILTLSRSCLASEDGADRTLATPTTLAAASAAAPAASATASTSSRAASPRANSPRDRSPREDADGGAAEDGGEEGGGGSEAPGQEGEAEDADAPEVVEPSESATEAQDGAVVVQVEEHEEGEDAEEGEEEDMSGMSACDFEEDFDRQADVERGYMFTQEDYDRIKFEAESVKKMWELETVEELYALAESIVKEMVAQGGAPAPAPAKAEDRTPSPARSTKSPPPGPG